MPVPHFERRSLLDVEAAASYLAVTPRWIRRAVTNKTVPYIKVGKLLRFDPDDLDRYLESHKFDLRGDDHGC